MRKRDGAIPERPSFGSPRVLVVDDEPAVLATLRLWLEQERVTAVCAQSYLEAICAARRSDVALAVVDYRLAEGDEGIRLGGALRRDFGVPFLLISGYLDVTIAVEAMKRGAVDVMAKPLKADRFLSAVERALLGKRSDVRRSTSVASIACQDTEGSAPSDLCPAVARLARMMLAACEAPEDPRTVPLWSHAIAISTSTIEETCHLCDVQPHCARDLARFLRALSLNRTAGAPLRGYFAVADERTLDGLFDRAGLAHDARTASLRTFLSRQTFIPTSAPCLRELGHLAANSPFFF